MADHYFAVQPRASHDERELVVELLGNQLRLTTDRGVFSRRRVDFGTRLLIETATVEPDAVILDLGCGYGAVGCALAKCSPQGQVFLVDVNARAVDLARRNVAANSLVNAEVRQGSGLDPVIGIRFDHVFLNPPVRAGKSTVHDLIASTRQYLCETGSLWVVVQTKQGAPSLKRFLVTAFGDVTEVARDSGYHVFHARHP